MRIDSPTMKTKLWSAIVTGEVRKKKASVMWNRDSDRIMVGPEIIGILAVSGCTRLNCGIIGAVSTNEADVARSRDTSSRGSVGGKYVYWKPDVPWKLCAISLA